MMNPDFLRLAILGNARAVGRLTAVLTGIAMGMALIVLLVGAFDGLDTRETRSAWIKPVGTAATPADIAGGATAVIAPMTDWFEDNSISRVDIYAPQGAVPRLVDIPAWPRPGTYLASPALAALIDATPPAELGNRYGTRAGILPDGTLKGPDSLAVVVGQDLQTIMPRNGLVLADTARGRPDTETTGFRTIAAIGAIGMLFPVLLFVAIATKLGAAARRESYSTLRLIGATPRQVGIIAGLETFVVATAGTAFGALLAVVLRPVAAQFRAVGACFFPADLDIGFLPTLVIAATIIVAATLVGAIGMHRARIGPLGAARAIAEKPVSWRRVLPLVIGMALIVVAGLPESLLPDEIVQVSFLGGFLLATIGIVAIGPWLTALAGRAMARLSGSATGIIVANRIAAAPVATFRSVSGLVLAVFMVTIFSAASAGVSGRFAINDRPDRMPVDALVTVVADGATAPDNLPGVTELISGMRGGEATYLAVFTGADLAALGVGGDRASDGLYRVDLRRFTAAASTAPLKITPVASVSGDPAPHVLIARTDGSPAAMETARTALQTEIAWQVPPMTRLESNLLGPARVMQELSTIAYSGALITILISGLSLSVSTLGAIIDRKRVFSLLRLVGMPAKALDRVVFLEAATPLAAVLVFAILAGYFAAWLIVNVLSDSIGIGGPDLSYILFLLAGLAGALVILQLSRRFVRHLIDGHAVRFE